MLLNVWQSAETAVQLVHSSLKYIFFVYQKYFAKLNIALNSLSMLIVLSEHLYLPNQVGYHQSQYQK